MHVLAAGHGDCLWVDYGDPDAPTRILVDAGTAGTFSRVKAALDKVRCGIPSHELLLITHIDADHIAGTLNVVEDGVLASQFKEFWFNGRDHLAQAAKLQSLGAVQGERLTAALKKLPGRWNTAFGRGPIMMPAAGSPPVKQVGAATVTVLGPRPAELAALLPVWTQEIKAAGLKNKVAAAKPKQIRPGWQSFGVTNVNKLANEAVTTDTAPANGSSISTIVEFQDVRLLLGADAHPDTLLDGIKRLSPQSPLKVSVWKLPHHGSAANVTDDLLAAVDAKTVVFSSNGAHFSHPDKIAVARVIRRYRQTGVHLVFNYKTKHNQIWESPALQSKWNYTTQYGSGLNGVSVHLI
jgi:beta-lactamase superfamily II metal-dependent hydrolase